MYKEEETVARFKFYMVNEKKPPRFPQNRTDTAGIHYLWSTMHRGHY